MIIDNNYCYGDRKIYAGAQKNMITLKDYCTRTIYITT